jgi:SAM-dependent methyltransferase
MVHAKIWTVAMTDDVKDLVRDGYDMVSRAYRSDDFVYAGSEYERFLTWITKSLAAPARVLDLGCGCGVPVCQILARQHDVVGVDLSPVQIARARHLVPKAQFLQADMMSVAFSDGRFDAVIAFYAIIHVPLEEQRDLLASVSRWLRPGGLFLVSVGRRTWTGTEDDWMNVQGATMYWSHTAVETYRQWFEAAGLQVEQEGFIPEGDGGHPVLFGTRTG